MILNLQQNLVIQLNQNVTTAITNYNTNTLQKFDSIYRHSKLTGLIDDTDTSILSNITTIKIRKSFTPTLSSSTKYDIYFRNSLFNHTLDTTHLQVVF